VNQSEEHIASLIDALCDLDIGTRWTAAGQLAEMGEEAVAALLGVLVSADWSVRHIAVWALGETRSTNAINALIVGLKDESLHVRLSAARGLEKSSDQRAIEALAHWQSSKL
jgi:HEAT repeat protein